MTALRILDMTPVGVENNHLRYKFSHGLPWIKHLETEHVDPERALAEAAEWAKEYRDEDPLGNMANAIGVSMHLDASSGIAVAVYKFRGVAEYFHSNT